MFKMVMDFINLKENEDDCYMVNAHGLIMNKKRINLMPTSEYKLKKLSIWNVNINNYINRYD